MTPVVVTVVVNGQPTQVSLNPEEPLFVAVPKALEQTKNVGQPPENWELRDTAGTLLSLQEKVELFNFAPGATLFLNLKAGIGGGRRCVNM